MRGIGEGKVRENGSVENGEDKGERETCLWFLTCLEDNGLLHISVST